jgi:TRAP-type transport system periplasmic protein
MIFSVFIGAWLFFQKITCKIVGQPTSVGPIQQVLEAPFFAELSKDSSIPLSFQYVPSNIQGFKEEYQLKFLREGFFDLVSLRFLQNEELEITLGGMDIPGLQSNFSLSRSFAEAVSPLLDENLQKNFQAKLLSTWAFGPQELICTKPIQNLNELKGLKIRVGGRPNSSIVRLFSALGAKPVYIEYGETLTALQNKLIDCGVSSYLSAESSGWFEYAPYRSSLNFGNGINGYVINLKTWDALNSRQKQLLSKHFKDLSDRMWEYSDESFEKSLLPCSPNDLTCQKNRRFKTKLIVFSKSDVSRLHQVVIDAVLKPWLKSCNELNPGCKAQWINQTKNTATLKNLNLGNL